MKKFLLPALAVLIFAAACKKNDDTTPAIMQMSGTLNAAQTIPNVGTSNGSGTVTGTYDPTTRVLNYTVTYSGITATAGHIHYGDPKHYSPKGVMVAFTNTGTSPITGTATLTQMQADSLLSGHTYVNLHTQAHPADGEIRANLTVK